MVWQDGLFAGGSFLFAIALIPTIRGNSKPALGTSVLTAGILVGFAGAYASLSLWLATASSGIMSILWSILAYQKAKSL